MPEIAALQATDRARPLPATLRRKAFATFMELPTDLAELGAAEEPTPLPMRLSSTAYARLMKGGVAWAAPSVRRRSMILRLVAASLAVALPAAALVYAAQRETPSRKPSTPSAVGPVDEPVDEPGDRILRVLGAQPATRADQPVTPAKPPVKSKPRRVVRSPAQVHGTRASRPHGRTAPSPREPAQKDLVSTVLDQVHQVVDSACGLTSTVLPICGGGQKSPPILGPSG
jgi:hypothetical protein